MNWRSWRIQKLSSEQRAYVIGKFGGNAGVSLVGAKGVSVVAKQTAKAVVRATPQAMEAISNERGSIAIGRNNRDKATQGMDNASQLLKGTNRSDPASYYSYNELHAKLREAGLTGKNTGFEAHHLLSKLLMTYYIVHNLTAFVVRALTEILSKSYLKERENHDNSPSTTRLTIWSSMMRCPFCAP